MNCFWAYCSSEKHKDFVSVLSLLNSQSKKTYFLKISSSTYIFNSEKYII